VITELEARLIARDLRGQFLDDALFQQSWARYFERAKGRENAPDLRRWLESDLGRETIISVGLGPREPLVPSPNGVELSACWHCAGRGYVRADVEPSHPNFGEALACQACRGGERRCTCAMCEPTAGQRLYDHSLCIDESGHDFEHPDACPRCTDAGVEPMRIPILAGVNRAALLASGLTNGTA
jgi:hypothetical protein